MNDRGLIRVNGRGAAQKADRCQCRGIGRVPIEARIVDPHAMLLPFGDLGLFLIVLWHCSRFSGNMVESEGAEVKPASSAVAVLKNWVLPL